jgi:hypothetical protein
VFSHGHQPASRVAQAHEPRPIAHKQLDSEFILEKPELPA